MAKSYSRYKTVGICTGTNTEFYHDRRVRVRRKNAHNIRNVMANNPTEEFDDTFIPYKEPRNNRIEPTDGTYKVYSKECDDFRGIYKFKNKVKK